MANSLYGKGREKFATASINWLTDNIKAVLVDTASYTVDIDVDEYLSDIPVGARTATSSNLAGKTATLGVCDANNVVFSSVTGNVSEAVVLYKDTGVEGTSPLIVYIDTASGLPVTPNSTDIEVRWSNGANKIFKL